MKTKASIITLALLAIPALAAAAEPGLTFTSAAVADSSGGARHEIYQYRAGDRLVVQVVDPIVCGQKAVHPRVVVQQDRLMLQYDLTEAPAGAKRPCTENSVFQVSGVPGGTLLVGFSGGAEAYSYRAIRP